MKQSAAGYGDRVPTGVITALIREIERYLAAVALYRDLGCQPEWRSEPRGNSFV